MPAFSFCPIFVGRSTKVPSLRESHFLVHSKKEKGQHQDDHKQGGEIGSHCFPKKEVGRETDQRRQAKAEDLAFG